MAISNNDAISLLTIIPKKLNGFERLGYIHLEVCELCRNADLVAIESLALSSRTGMSAERAGLWYMVKYWLWKNGVPSVDVSPTQLKKFVTGKGVSEKDKIMLEVYKRWSVTVANSDEADAYGLLRIVMTMTGAAVAETNAQREVVAAIEAKRNEAQ